MHWTGTLADVETALRELRIEYKLSGDEAIARCPAHNDRHPSWSVNTTTGVHHCFSCGFSGNFASLVVRLLNLSYPEAVLWCNERLGWSRAHQWREDYEARSYAPAHLKVSEVDLSLFIEPPAIELERRGLSSHSLTKYELLWDKKEDAWIIPVRGPFHGELWGWQSKNARHFRNYPQGIKRSETLYGLGSFPDGSTAVVVESPIDCPYLFSAGINGGLSTYGVHISARQFSLIQYVTDTIVFALDNDSSGVGETARICEEAGRFRNARVFNYGSVDAKDPGEMTYEEVREGIRTALPVLRWQHVYRNFERISKESGVPVSRPWKLISSIHDGTWQDTYSHSSSGRVVSVRRY